jgi:hypothetical protein
MKVSQKWFINSATTLLPEQAKLSRTRDTIIYSDPSVFCVDRSSWVGSGCCSVELLISGPQVRSLHGPPFIYFPPSHSCLISPPSVKDCKTDISPWVN